jgi:16S rRNA (cytosine967-C5)-methyltransferase
MRALWSHILRILQTYTGDVPLHHFLKAYFKKEPKLGSRDRKAISAAAYAWYRVGKGIGGGVSSEANILAALAFCGDIPKPLLPQVQAESAAPQATVETGKILSFDVPMSDGITRDEWTAGLIRQPRLFLRIRKNKAEIKRRLDTAGIEQEWISDACLALPNGTRVEDQLQADWYVVQDAASQETGRYLQGTHGETWWDCCAGAGGKSLLLMEQSPGIRLLSTDIRQTILKNLRERFSQYGFSAPETMVLDTEEQHAVQTALGSRTFNGIICDVPCTGSGTWARTPESLFFFNPISIATYAEKQRAILRHAAARLKPGGRLIYITCSVFRAENEEVIDAVAQSAGLVPVQGGLINRIDIGGDALFAMELKKA